MFDVSSIKSLETFPFEMRGGKTGMGLLINGTPYLLWTHVYQNLEMTNPHSVQALSRLEQGKHYISLSSGEMKEIKSRYNVTLYPGFNSSVFYFISAEGFNRVIMDIDTSRMKDQIVARNIIARKNKMAEVFTKYQAGTLLPTPKRNMPRLGYPIGYVPIAPVFKDRKAVAKGLGFPDRTANVMALQQTEEITGQSMAVFVKALPLLQQKNEDRRFTSSVIAEKFGISKARSNRFLADNGLVEPFGTEWVLTDLGKKFGVMEPTVITTGNKTVVKHHPRWSPDVIAYLKKHNPVKGQKQLS